MATYFYSFLSRLSHRRGLCWRPRHFAASNVIRPALVVPLEALPMIPITKHSVKAQIYFLVSWSVSKLAGK